MSKTSRLFTTLAVASLTALTSVGRAQMTGTDFVQRDANQETRIRDGLQDGSLSTREAAQLQRQESRVDRLQAGAAKDGTLTQAERQRITAAENRVSNNIKADSHNGVIGMPNSASAKRMEQGAQRDINQQQRIETGIQKGQLNTHDVGTLERGQARVDRAESSAGRGGRESAAQARHIGQAQNGQSARIHNQRLPLMERR